MTFNEHENNVEDEKGIVIDDLGSDENQLGGLVWLQKSNLQYQRGELITVNEFCNKWY